MEPPSKKQKTPRGDKTRCSEVIGEHLDTYLPSDLANTILDYDNQHCITALIPRAEQVKKLHVMLPCRPGCEAFHGIALATVSHQEDLEACADLKYSVEYTQGDGNCYSKKAIFTGERGSVVTILRSALGGCVQWVSGKESFQFLGMDDHTVDEFVSRVFHRINEYVAQW